jgi:hypothetical protein
MTLILSLGNLTFLIFNNNSIALEKIIIGILILCYICNKYPYSIERVNKILNLNNL